MSRLNLRKRSFREKENITDHFIRKEKNRCIDETKYEGRSICNENRPINPKVLYVHTSRLITLKDLFLGYAKCKVVVIQLLNFYTSRFHDRVVKSTVI